MGRAIVEVRSFSAQGLQVSVESYDFSGETYLSEGYGCFMRTVGERSAGGIALALCRRDFSDNFLGQVVLKPEAGRPEANVGEIMMAFSERFTDLFEHNIRVA